VTPPTLQNIAASTIDRGIITGVMSQGAYHAKVVAIEEPLVVFEAHLQNKLTLNITK